MHKHFEKTSTSVFEQRFLEDSICFFQSLKQCRWGNINNCLNDRKHLLSPGLMPLQAHADSYVTQLLCSLQRDKL